MYIYIYILYIYIYICVRWKTESTCVSRHQVSLIFLTKFFYNISLDSRKRDIRKLKSWKTSSQVVSGFPLPDIQVYKYITGRAHYFPHYIYITPILLLWDLSTLCVMNHLWPYICIYIIYVYIYIYVFVFSSLCLCFDYIFWMFFSVYLCQCFSLGFVYPPLFSVGLLYFTFVA